MSSNVNVMPPGEVVLRAALGLYMQGCPIPLLFREAMTRARDAGIEITEADMTQAQVLFAGNLPSNGGPVRDMPDLMVIWTLKQALDVAQRQS